MSLLSTQYTALAKRLSTLESGERVSLSVPNDQVDDLQAAIEDEFGNDFAIESEVLTETSMYLKIARSS